MSKKIEIFHTVRQNIAALGLAPNQQQQSKYRKVSRYQIWIGILSIDLSAHCVFFFHGADGVEDFMDVIYEFIIESSIFITFISIILKNGDLFNVLEFIEKELTASE